jgi:hypothetical protein
MTGGEIAEGLNHAIKQKAGAVSPSSSTVLYINTSAAAEVLDVNDWSVSRVAP